MHAHTLNNSMRQYSILSWLTTEKKFTIKGENDDDEEYETKKYESIHFTPEIVEDLSDISRAIKEEKIPEAKALLLEKRPKSLENFKLDIVNEGIKQDGIEIPEATYLTMLAGIYKEENDNDAAQEVAAMAAQSNSIEAEVILGNIAFEQGYHQLAKRYFEKASKANHPMGLYFMGYYCDPNTSSSHTSGDIDMSQSMLYYQQAADMGLEQARRALLNMAIQIGRNYVNNEYQAMKEDEYYARNRKVALGILRYMAEVYNDPDAMFQYALFGGIKTKSPSTRAIHYLARLVEEFNHAESSFILGQLYERVKRLRRPKFALQYYLQAANLGMDAAHFHLARFYTFGLGCERDAEKAFEHAILALKYYDTNQDAAERVHVSVAKLLAELNDSKSDTGRVALNAGIAMFAKGRQVESIQLLKLTLDVSEDEELKANAANITARIHLQGVLGKPPNFKEALKVLQPYAIDAHPKELILYGQILKKIHDSQQEYQEIRNKVK
eukprot:CAMPEP_0117419636 /NCGR_PEP_ID=MMETSP0758-20121206/1154_1 /TAXON_ID=63605 /ORGANISM="Percolomonas cosmopolitus, Strain AE-1 (ATCC 50343)" /LENGTH=496 /DNA_ID=CAMNT_0005200811 /DNA_START=40 /DNA_END=1527 /DNA_ORIENTATION=+